MSGIHFSARLSLGERCPQPPRGLGKGLRYAAPRVPFEPLARRKTNVIRVVAQFKICDVIHAQGGSAVAADVVAATSGPLVEDSIERMMRAAAGLGLLHCTADGDKLRFSNTPQGELLRADHPQSVRAGILWESAPQMQRTWADGVLDFCRTGKEQWRVGMSAHPDTDKDAFDAVMNNPDWPISVGEAFAAIGRMGLAEIASCEPLLDLLKTKSTICDLGCGGGNLLHTLLAAAPHLQGTQFDRPETIERLVVPSELAGRVSTVAGSFFDKVPEGMDVYTMKLILHDWHDAECISILETIKKSMKPGATILVFDHQVHDDDPAEAGKFMDLHMGVVVGGRERSRAQLTRVVEAAGLKVTDVLPTKGEYWVVVIEA